MARVTVADIKAILDTSLEDVPINAFIASANALVTNKIAVATVTQTDDQLKEIERWLAAHFIASTREQQLQKAKAGSAVSEFQGITGKGLAATFYGQNALLLDISGTLSELGKPMASISAVTTEDWHNGDGVDS